MLISIFVYFWLYLVYFRWGSRLICELFEGFASLPGSAACLRIWVQILPGLEAKRYKRLERINANAGEFL